MPNIADRLIQLQQDRNLQKKDIAEAAGLSVMGYYRYEKGQREPTASTIVKLCNALDCSADYLLGRTDKP